MKRLMMMCAVLATVGSAWAEQTGGTLFFRDGRSVPFESTGAASQFLQYQLQAQMGDQLVEYFFSDFKEIIFSDERSRSAVLVSKSGDRFAVTDCRFFSCSDGGSMSETSRFYYRYLDPVTKNVKTGKSHWHLISHIEMGASSGRLRRNPVTKEFFPARYNFDPFTGQKLEWANS